LKIILFSLILILNIAWAEASELINLKNGQKNHRSELLKSGKILVYLEKNCEVCESYLEEIQKCPQNIKDKIVFVSVDTPAQSQKMRSKIPADKDLFVIKGGASSEVQATPTTVFANGQRVGIIKCSELEALAL
jgi:hypothetical protein